MKIITFPWLYNFDIHFVLPPAGKDNRGDIFIWMVHNPPLNFDILDFVAFKLQGGWYI